MAIRTKQELKAMLADGQKLTGAKLHDLIDSLAHVSELTGNSTTTTAPTTTQAGTTTAAPTTTQAPTTTVVPPTTTTAPATTAAPTTTQAPATTQQPTTTAAGTTAPPPTTTTNQVATPRITGRSLKVWSNARQLTQASGTISTFPNLADTNNPFVQNATGNAPLVTAVNGKRCLQFNSQKWMLTPQAVLTDQYYTVLVAVRRGSGALGTVLSDNGAEAYGENFHLQFANSTTARLSHYHNDLYGTVPAYQAGRWEVFSARMNASGRQMYLNDALIGSDAFTEEVLTDNLLQLGAGTSSHRDGFDGYIGEVIVYNAALSDAEFAQERAYLLNFWVGATTTAAGTTSSGTTTFTGAAECNALLETGQLDAGIEYYEAYSGAPGLEVPLFNHYGTSPSSAPMQYRQDITVWAGAVDPSKIVRIRIKRTGDNYVWIDEQAAGENTVTVSLPDCQGATVDILIQDALSTPTTQAVSTTSGGAGTNNTTTAAATTGSATTTAATSARITGRNLKVWSNPKALSQTSGVLATLPNLAVPGNPFEQNTQGLEPLVATFAGHRCLQLDGNKWMRTPQAVLTADYYTVFIVVARPAGDPGSSTFLSDNGADAQDENFHLQFVNPTTARLSHYGNDMYGAVPEVTSARWELIAARMNASGRQLYLNDALIDSDAYATVLTTDNLLQLGARGVLQTDRFTGYIGEVIVYNDALTDAEFAQERAALLTDWSIT